MLCVTTEKKNKSTIQFTEFLEVCEIHYWYHFGIRWILNRGKGATFLIQKTKKKKIYMLELSRSRNTMWCHRALISDPRKASPAWAQLVPTTMVQHWI